jgi:LmbE family N-acetylglucosaminyl deacetylase
VFVVAHADDWQLFMGEVVVEALRRGDPVLAVLTNAGDAGRGNEFWRTREVAALASMRAAEALAGAPVTTPLCNSMYVPGQGWASNRASAAASAVPNALNGAGAHRVRGCRTPHMTTVFLRLPDGKPGGTGYAEHGFVSMKKLADSTIGRLDALDSSTSYRSIDDLGATVTGIIREHQRLGLTMQVHTADPDLLENPIDHSDHRITGQLAIEAARALRVPVMLYGGYSNLRRADNLAPEAAAWKSYCFVAYDRAMMTTHGSWSAYAENAWAHAQYLSRTYARAFHDPGFLRHGVP